MPANSYIFQEPFFVSRTRVICLSRGSHTTPAWETHNFRLKDKDLPVINIKNSRQKTLFLCHLFLYVTMKGNHYHVTEKEYEG